MNKITIIDYGMGNIKSVFRAVEKMGGKPIVTNDPATVTESKKILKRNKIGSNIFCSIDRNIIISLF